MRCAAISVLVLGAPASHARTPASAGCGKIVIQGEVKAGQEWKTALGEGWVFRVLPIEPGKAGYSGWDLAVDRAEPAGFPDALLLATLPYNSINEREVGTTFGLRAQDAIGWNPRSFRFLTDPAALKEGQTLYRIVEGRRQSSHDVGSDPEVARATARLLDLEKRSATGEFHILDAHLMPGVADPAAFAQGWALAAQRTPHEIERAGQAGGAQPTPRGSLNWVRFSLVLWLPGKWVTPPGLHATPSPCVR